jgi:hypothetical protein
MRTAVLTALLGTLVGSTVALAEVTAQNVPTAKQLFGRVEGHCDTHRTACIGHGHALAESQ